jgi:hypothetical protein
MRRNEETAEKNLHLAATFSKTALKPSLSLTPPGNYRSQSAFTDVCG